MITIRKAVPEDNEGLLHLSAITPMKGRITISIERNPDYFQMLRLRGESFTYIAEDHGKIIASFSGSGIPTSLKGKCEKVYYIADLRIHPDYTSKTVTIRLLKRMEAFLEESGADLLFCTAAYGNSKVMPLFEGRAGLPEFTFTGIFRVLQIIPLSRKISPGKFILKETEINDEIIDLYNSFYSRYDFAPDYTRTCLRGSTTYSIYEGSSLRASISLIDVEKAKQNILIALPFILKVVTLSLKLLNKFLGIFNLPEIGKSVRILYIKAFAFADGYEDTLDILIRKAMNVAFINKYCYLTVGIHERDPLVIHFDRYLHITFQSMGFIVSMKGNKEKVDRIKNGVLFEDYSLV